SGHSDLTDLVCRLRGRVPSLVQPRRLCLELLDEGNQRFTVSRSGGLVIGLPMANASDVRGFSLPLHFALLIAISALSRDSTFHIHAHAAPFFKSARSNYF